MIKEQWERITEIAQHGRSSMRVIDPQSVDMGLLIFGGMAPAGRGSGLEVLGSADDLMTQLVLQLMGDPVLRMLFASAVANAEMRLANDTCNCEHCVDRRATANELQKVLEGYVAKGDPFGAINDWVQFRQREPKA